MNRASSPSARDRKRGCLGDQVFTYDAHNYLALSAALRM
jgi:hypothetical protein